MRWAPRTKALLEREVLHLIFVVSVCMCNATAASIILESAFCIFLSERVSTPATAQVDFCRERMTCNCSQNSSWRNLSYRPHSRNVYSCIDFYLKLCIHISETLSVVMHHFHRYNRFGIPFWVNCYIRFDRRQTKRVDIQYMSVVPFLYNFSVGTVCLSTNVHRWYVWQQKSHHRYVSCHDWNHKFTWTSNVDDHSVMLQLAPRRTELDSFCNITLPLLYEGLFDATF